MRSEIEISLQCEGKSLFEYYATFIPRVNDLMDLDVDDDKGKYRVREVTHRVFRAKDGSIATYVKVDVEIDGEESIESWKSESLRLHEKIEHMRTELDNLRKNTDKEKLLQWLEDSKKASREQIDKLKDAITFHFTNGEENAFGLVEIAIISGKFDL